MTTLGQRAVEVARKELEAGVREKPPGSNTGDRIRQYLAPCVRRGSEIPLHLVASNWCMAFASWCHQQAILPTDKPAHGYRAGVVEAVSDAMDPDNQWFSEWHPVEEVVSGVWQFSVGDLAIYDRSQPGKPETSWWRHVNRVSGLMTDATGHKKHYVYVAIGGNEQDRVRETIYRISNPKLLGFIGYPKQIQQPKMIQAQSSRPMLSAREREQIENMVAMTIDGMLRDSIWGQR